MATNLLYAHLCPLELHERRAEARIEEPRLQARARALRVARNRRPRGGLRGASPPPCSRTASTAVSRKILSHAARYGRRLTVRGMAGAGTPQEALGHRAKEARFRGKRWASGVSRGPASGGATSPGEQKGWLLSRCVALCPRHAHVTSVYSQYHEALDFGFGAPAPPRVPWAAAARPLS